MKFGLLIEGKKRNNICMSTVMDSAGDLPQKVSLREYCSPIQDQEDRGFCWAFTAAEFKAMQEHMETGRLFQMSALYCAKKGKEIDGTYEDGATSETLFKVINGVGAIEDKYYPYSLKDGMEGSLKFPTVDESVSHYKCDVPVRLNSIKDIDRALSMGHPVALGIVCLDSIYDLKDNAGDVIPMPIRGFVAGGHEVIIAGYDNTMTRVDKYDHKEHKGFYLIKNTWGESWGDKGWAWLPKDYLTYSVQVTSTSRMTFFVDAYTAMDLTNEYTNENVIQMQIGEKRVKINGKAVEWDVAPQIEADRTLVPLRGICEVLGYRVDWNDKEKRIILTKDKTEIVMFIGSNIVLINGKTQTWEVAPKIDEKTERTLVPLRPIAELLGFYVYWKDSTKEITLVKEG